MNLDLKRTIIPLMIEAIPISMDSIVLIITKVEDPDELDTRFFQNLHRFLLPEMIRFPPLQLLKEQMIF